MARAPGQDTKEIEILRIEEAKVRIAVVGEDPIILNRVSEKTKIELLAPMGKKTGAARAQSLKHMPLEEYRNSPYTLADPKAPTLLAGLAVWFKKAAMTAALDTPGAKKAQMGRLLRVEGERVPLYGVPELFMAVTRSSDINRTPDIRTRAIVPKWAMILEVTFPKQILKEKSVLNLFASGGRFSGVGDWRTEKGSANYGSFRLAGADDLELQSIMKTGGRVAQIKAMAKPTFYDDETESLYKMWMERAEGRGFKVAV